MREMALHQLCLAILLLATLRTPTLGAEYFVAADGNDAASGSLNAPLASLKQAQNLVQPGDTVYLRGGTYQMTNDDLAGSRGLFARLVVLDKSGTRQAPITYCAYQNERPVFDCSLVRPEQKRVTAFYVSGAWLRLVGIEVIGVQVTIKSHTQSICFESQGSHNVFERLSLHDGQAIGIYHVRGSENLFVNCDAWNNYDVTSEQGKGGNVDGFGAHPKQGSVKNVFRGCRAWFNSDDGFDCINAHEAVTFENCWALYNGYSPDFGRLADGNGFKAGGYGDTPAERLPDPIPRHVVRCCVAVRNKNSGFYANHHPGGCDWLNNSAFRNGINFNLLNRDSENAADVPGYAHKLTGNLSYGSPRGLINIDLNRCELTDNSFELRLPLTDADFESLDPDDLLAPRQPNGDLPVTGFMQPLHDDARLLGANPSR